MRWQFAEAFNPGAKGIRALRKGFDRVTIARRHMNGEQARVRLFA